jgi:hypothetical protein
MVPDTVLSAAVAVLDVARPPGPSIVATMLAASEVVPPIITVVRHFTFAVIAAFADWLMMFSRFTLQSLSGLHSLITVSHLQPCRQWGGVSGPMNRPLRRNAASDGIERRTRALLPRIARCWDCAIRAYLPDLLS